MKKIEDTHFALGGTRFAWTLDRDESLALLDAYSDRFNIPILDTADSYVQWVPGRNGGESEELIGEWMSIRKNRESVFICTKIGKKSDRIGLSFNNVVSATMESLGRLRTTYLDLLVLHSWNSDAKVEEVVNGLSYLYKRGLIRSLGVSNFPAKILKETHHALVESLGIGISFIQYHYNLIERDSTRVRFDDYTLTSNFGFESQILPWAEANGIISMPYHPLARGFLSEKYLGEPNNIVSIHRERVMKYYGFNVKPLLLETKRIADKYQTYMSNVALSWLTSRGSLVLPVVSFSTTQQLSSLKYLPTLTLEEKETLTNLSDALRQ